MEGELSAAATAVAAISSISLGEKVGGDGWAPGGGCSSSSGKLVGSGICAICLERIVLQEVALVKGCEHAYCATCILRWASCSGAPSCPQCKQTFDSLIVHRALDGCIRDFMSEESVCLLLRASWFVPLAVEVQEEACDGEDINMYAAYEEYDADDDDAFEEDYFVVARSSPLHIGNRRWGDGGYIRSGRKEARPVNRASAPSSSSSGSGCRSSSSSRKDKEVAKAATGRRAKRALKREAADKAAATADEEEEEHRRHPARPGGTRK